MKKAILALKDALPAAKADALIKLLESTLGIPVVVLNGVHQLTIIDTPEEPAKMPEHKASEVPAE